MVDFKSTQISPKYFWHPNNPDLSINKTSDKKLRRFVFKLFAREGHLHLIVDFKYTQITPYYFWYPNNPDLSTNKTKDIKLKGYEV